MLTSLKVVSDVNSTCYSSIVDSTSFREFNKCKPELFCKFNEASALVIKSDRVNTLLANEIRVPFVL